MAIKHGEVNPLAVFAMRRLDFCPPHFVKVKFDMKASERIILDWIYENTDGRFFSSKSISDGEGGGLCECVAFENHAESTHFALILTQINVYSYI